MSGHKILVIRFSSLGDIILTLPVYKNLKIALPDSFVAVATKEKYLPLLKGNPHIDLVLPLQEGESIFSFLSKIKKEKFTVLIDLHHNLRSNFISIFSGIPKKIRVNKAVWKRRLFVKKRVRDPELNRHSIDRYLDTLKLLGIQPQAFPPELYAVSPTSEESSEHQIRFLIIQTAFLGDAVLTTPLFEAIRKSYPSAKITLLCTPENQQLFESNPHINELLAMDKRGRERRVFSIFRWAQRLKNRFDIALLPHRSFRSALIAWLAKIPVRIGFENSEGRFLLTEKVPFDWKMHDAERNLTLLNALGIASSSPKFFVPQLSPQNLSELLSTFPKDAPWIGINPGSVWKTKQWLPERFAEVADALIEETNCKILLFGSEKDAEAVNAVVSAMKHVPVNFCGKTDLKTLAWLIAKCSLFITNDSGPMHIACAADVPVVAIFGPTTRELGFFPYGKKSKVVELDLPCRPCSLHGGEKCPLKHFKCMREISAEMVLSSCREFLKIPAIET